jgi:hypothetical protein
MPPVRRAPKRASSVREGTFSTSASAVTWVTPRAASGRNAAYSSAVANPRRRAAALLCLVPGHGRLRQGINDQRARPILARAIEGKGAFRRFKDRLHQNYPELLPAWHAFQSIRAKRRAVQWLVDNSLVDQQAAAAVLAHYADPHLP